MTPFSSGSGETCCGFARVSLCCSTAFCRYGFLSLLMPMLCSVLQATAALSAGLLKNVPILCHTPMVIVLKKIFYLVIMVIVLRIFYLVFVVSEISLEHTHKI
jgi:hypothetical protein